MSSPTICCLRAEWQALGTSEASVIACRRLAVGEPLVADLDVADLAELVSALACGSGRLSRTEAAAVIAAMLHSAAVDPLVSRAIVQALLPGVLALAGGMDTSSGPWYDTDAFFTDAISSLWEQITRWSGTTRAYAAGDLLSGARTRLRTLQRSERRRRGHQIAFTADIAAIESRADRSVEEDLAAALAVATGHGIALADAAVLYGTRILGMSLGELARLAGTTVAELREREWTAAAQLVA